MRVNGLVTCRLGSKETGRKWGLDGTHPPVYLCLLGHALFGPLLQRRRLRWACAAARELPDGVILRDWKYFINSMNSWRIWRHWKSNHCSKVRWTVCLWMYWLEEAVRGGGRQMELAKEWSSWRAWRGWEVCIDGNKCQLGKWKGRHVATLTLVIRLPFYGV
jgi:hypothetical protein